jgi:uncharacterized membrane protein YjjP (DUF1212 family)
MTYFILYGIGLAMFWIYTIWVIQLVGMQKLTSFSQTYYELEKIRDRYKYLFQVVMLGMCFLFAIVMFQLTEGLWFQFVGAFTVLPIGFVGFAPRFEVGNMLERDVHFTAAYTSAGFSLIWVTLLAIYVNWHIALTIPAASVVAFLLYKLTGVHTKVWWAEMACFWWTQATMAMLFKV